MQYRKETEAERRQQRIRAKVACIRLRMAQLGSPFSPGTTDEDIIQGAAIMRRLSLQKRLN